MSNIVQFPGEPLPPALAEYYLPPAAIARLQAVHSGEDLIFHDIRRHQEAIDAHSAAVEAQCEAEGKVSSELCAELERQTSAAFHHMMFRGRILVPCPVASRRGLIALAKHLEKQFDVVADSGGCNSIPDSINGRLFFRSLALRLRRIGPEFEQPKSRRKGSKKSGLQEGPVTP